MSTLRDLWRHHRAALLIFLGGGLVTLLFLTRLIVFTIYWADPAHRFQPPEPWMTPRYIARSWGLDPDDLETALGARFLPGRPPTLQRIARERGVPVETVIDEVRAMLPPEGAK